MGLPDNPIELRKMDKEDIIKGYLEGQTYSKITLIKDKFGNNESQLDESYDAYSGNLVGKRLVTWTYYDAKVGNVKDVKAEEFYEEGSPKSLLVTRQDEAGKEQPVVVKRQAFAKLIPKPKEL